MSEQIHIWTRVIRTDESHIRHIYRRIDNIFHNQTTEVILVAPAVQLRGSHITKYAQKQFKLENYFKIVEFTHKLNDELTQSWYNLVIVLSLLFPDINNSLQSRVF